MSAEGPKLRRGAHGAEMAAFASNLRHFVLLDELVDGNSAELEKFARGQKQVCGFLVPFAFLFIDVSPPFILTHFPPLFCF